jgi:3-phenylpropionate/trans-cinnamate dioxygenase ferredoxin subunit
LTGQSYEAVLPVDELRPGQMRACTLAGREIVVCRTPDGIFALDGVCSHAYAQMSEGRLRGTRLICPLHGAAYDVRDGRVLAPPARSPLPVHAVRIVRGVIEIAVNPDAPAALSAE